MIDQLKRFLDQIKYKYSPTIPDVDYKNYESRRNWILFMAHRTGRLPVREIYDKMMPHVSKMTISVDLNKLEEAGLIRRERLKHRHSFVIPLFEDSGIKEKNEIEKRKDLWLNYGLPLLNIILLIVLFALLSS